MPETVDAVFFDTLHLSFVFAGAFAGILHGSASLKTSTPGRKRVWAGIILFGVRAGIILFGGLQGRVGPEG
jgi:hypothetical protein